MIRSLILKGVGFFAAAWISSSKGIDQIKNTINAFMIACCVNLIVFQLTLLAADHLYPSFPAGSKKNKNKKCEYI